MRKSILSWDCGHRSLAYVRLDVPADVPAYLDQIQKLLGSCTRENASEVLPEVLRLLDGFIVVLAMDCLDVLGATIAETPPAARAAALKRVLAGIPTANVVLVEDQPLKIGFATNVNSVEIGHQIMYHYAGTNVSSDSARPPEPVQIFEVSSRLKSKMSIAGEKLPKKSTRPQRKKFAEKWLKHFCGKFHYDLSRYEPWQLNHMADALMQAVCWLGQGKN
jgi:hypothetical protein